uniref:Integrase catalytic domain-containing protein n=1 Tax=Fagus sylvatica TaxID=28930 RepID=A0A2N9IGY8_FAGSY
MAESTDLMQQLNPQTESLLTSLTTKMTEVLTRSQTSPHPPPADSSTAPIGIKLDGSNYALWSQVVEMYISGKDKLGYINGDSPQPPETDPSFRRWRTENAIVKGWLINSMDSSLIANFIRFPTAKQVWDSAATTYFDGTDTSQVYDLRRRVTRTKQAGGSIEKYYNDLQGLWREIDFRRPNPMECANDIQKYNSILQEDRVYIFLDGLDDRLDKTRSDVLQLKPFPTVEQAYAHVRREDVRQMVMTSGANTAPGVVMASKGIKAGHYHTPPKTGVLSLSSGKSNPPSKSKAPSDGMKCTHCGNAKHTRETCFKLHGYPDWWHDLQARKKHEAPVIDDSTGRVAMVTGEPSLSLTSQVESSHNPGNCSNALHSSTHNDDDNWILDSGATDHMTFDSNDFSHITPPRRSHVANANGVTYPVTGAGIVTLSPSLSLSHTLLVPSLSNKLMSVSQVTADLNCVVLMYSTFCLLQDILTKEIIGRGTKRGGLYYVDDFSPSRANHMHHTVNNKERQIWLWHHRLGHPSFGYLKHLFPDLFSNTMHSNFKCNTCILAKSHRVSYPVSMNKSAIPFALIHSDVWGPSPVTTSSGHRWFVIFVDDCTRMTWLYLLKHKDEVFDVFKSFHIMVQTQFSAKIQILRSDNGGEYVNQPFQAYFQSHGLFHETSCSQTPQQNGIAERKNRHILETARALLIGAHVPSRYWDDAVATAVHLLNRMPTKVLTFQTPLKVLSNHVPLPTVLMIPPRIFGCVAFVHLHKNQRTKLDPCAVRCLFLGYGLHKKGYRCFDPTTKRTYITMDVTFLESDTFFPSPASNSTLQGELRDEEQNWWGSEELHVEDNPAHMNDGNDMIEPDVQTFVGVDMYPRAEPVSLANAESEDESPHSSVPDPNDPPSENIPEVSSPTTPLHTNAMDTSTGYVLPFRHNRGKPPNRYSPDIEERRSKYPIANYVSTQRLSEPLKAFAHTLSSCNIPSSVEEALSDPKWAQAIKEELEALQKNKTWALVVLPEGKKTVGCKWIFSIKYKADGSIDRCKARLVAKGYTQTYGIDYHETFSPVAKLNTVRVLLSLAANLDWPLHQLDVKNAFLHGDLEEEVYMDIPPGYTASSKAKIACKLQRALYGLKQSPRAWFGRFSSAMRKYGFQQSNSDHTLFLKHRLGKVTALIVYVDDMIITGDDAEEISRLQEQLSTEFEMKNLGGLKYFLGIEVARSRQGIFLSQRKYVLDLLSEVGLLECKPADTPIVPNHKLGEYTDQVSSGQREVSTVSCEDHMDAVIRILRYLKSSPGKGLMFSKNNHLNVDGYTDADWAGNISDRKSTSGYFTFVGGNLVTWRSKKQKVVALSSAEAEFRGMAKGLCELLWLRRLLAEIGFAPSSEMNLFCDNKAAIDISHNPVQHDRTKHVEVDRHFIKHNLEEKIIRFPFVKSEDQLADILTKAVSTRNFYDSLDKLGIRDIYAPT